VLLLTILRALPSSATEGVALPKLEPVMVIWLVWKLATALTIAGFGALGESCAIDPMLATVSRVESMRTEENSVRFAAFI
jgi:hypothetical protein